jgi:adenosylcobyric acid synthase
MKNATTIMVQGTTSDAGKSTIVTALCRILHRRGHTVAPFKPQNMSLNSAVAATTADNGGGGEIGRAQAVQAAAAGVITPHVDMNPVLLKPQNDCTSQIIVLGKVVGTLEARNFNHKKESLLPVVVTAHERLVAQYEYVIVEGAGSPAEVNLRKGDIANMGFAEAIDCPVVICVDIDKGGAYAHLLGTFLCLSDTEQARIVGFIINKFRGDQSLLHEANEWLLHKTGVPILAVVPYVPDLFLEAEDAVDVRQTFLDDDKDGVVLNVIVVAYPHMSNHTDFDTMRLHPQINLTYARHYCPSSSSNCDLMILPGSKMVVADLTWLRASKWDVALNRHLRYGGKVLGICGGYQMLGQTIRDPHGVEGGGGNSSAVVGLAKLNVDTVLQTNKLLRQVTGRCAKSGVDVFGYEIHVGTTMGPDQDERPLLQRRCCVEEEEHYVGGNGDECHFVNEGAQSFDGQVAGCYWHGLFDSPAYLSHIAAWATNNTDVGQSSGSQQRRGIIGAPLDLQAHKEEQFDRLADAVEQAWPYEDLMRLMAKCKD